MFENFGVHYNRLDKSKTPTIADLKKALAGVQSVQSIFDLLQTYSYNVHKHMKTLLQQFSPSNLSDILPIDGYFANSITYKRNNKCEIHYIIPTQESKTTTVKQIQSLYIQASNLANGLSNEKQYLFQDQVRKKK